VCRCMCLQPPSKKLDTTANKAKAQPAAAILTKRAAVKERKQPAVAHELLAAKVVGFCSVHPDVPLFCGSSCNLHKFTAIALCVDV